LGDQEVAPFNLISQLGSKPKTREKRGIDNKILAGALTAHKILLLGIPFPICETFFFSA
jgi:hypothetical protein